MGFNAHYVGMIGELYGEPLLNHLESEKVNTKFVQKTNQDRTGFSTILNSFEGDRTVMVYSGANQWFNASHLPLEAMKKADLIFLNHLSEPDSTVIDALATFFEQNPTISLAWNPGGKRLQQGAARWQHLLRHVNVLFLNKQEAALFSGKNPIRNLPEGDEPGCQLHVSRSYLPTYADDVTEMMAELLQYGVQQVVITDGRNGAQATDGKQLYFCPVVSCKRVDSLGAGDAFATGYMTAFLAEQNLNHSLKYGTINAYHVVSRFGAQAGLLTWDRLQESLQKESIDVRSTPFPTF
ncbi:carbohydrate kinase family protein [Candidatus Peregrinibacteria bacterium]|nr:MAG: carbohydrate kinase family protein [Candidatus Peregrinibacteria bacterium]